MPRNGEGVRWPGGRNSNIPQYPGNSTYRGLQLLSWLVCLWLDFVVAVCISKFVSSLNLTWNGLQKKRRLGWFLSSFSFPWLFYSTARKLVLICVGWLLACWGLLSSALTSCHLSPLFIAVAAVACVPSLGSWLTSLLALGFPRSSLLWEGQMCSPHFCQGFDYPVPVFTCGEVPLSHSNLFLPDVFWGRRSGYKHDTCGDSKNRTKYLQWHESLMMRM